MKQTESKNSLGVNQFGLESVPEEDELDDDEELEEDEEDEDEQMYTDDKCLAFVNAQQNLRYVDSSSEQNSIADEGLYEQLNEADVLRKAAAQYYNSSSSLVGRKANIMSLRGNRVNGNYEGLQHGNNQFI